MAIEEGWWKVKKSMYSPTEVSKWKTLHELGPPQGCSAALLPSLSIARDFSEGGTGHLSKMRRVCLLKHR